MALTYVGSEVKPSTIGERIMMIIMHYGLNKNSFSIKIGLSGNSLIVRIVNDPEAGISLTLTQKILTTFSEINPEWFVMGTGSMLRDEQFPNLKIHFIKYYREFTGKMNGDPTDLLRMTGFEDCDVAFDVVGSGMSPKYRTGDIIICRKEDVNGKIKFGEAFLIISDGEPLIRYIKSKIDEIGFKLGAEDARYEESTIDLKDIQSLYLIKGLVRKEVF